MDFGANVDDDALPVAKEALVYLDVSVNAHWKIPVGYFLIDGLTSDERANLLTTCLCKLHEVGTNIVPVTFDGSSSNLGNEAGMRAEIIDPNSFFCPSSQQ